MTRLELIRLLSSSDEDEVLINIEGTLYEIEDEIEHVPESFDGFMTSMPSAVGLKPKLNQCEI